MAVSAWVSGTTYAVGSVISYASGSTLYYKRTNINTTFTVNSDPITANTWWENISTSQNGLIDIWFGYIDTDGRMLINSQNLIENSSNLGW